MAETLFEWFWTQVWQVTLLIVLVGLVSHLWLQKKPRWSLALWMLVIAKCLFPPIWASWLGIFSWCQADGVDSIGTMAHDWILSRIPSSALSVLIGIWIGGILVHLAIALVRWGVLFSALNHCRARTPAAVDNAVQRVKAALPGLRPVEVIVTSTPIGPAAFGFWRKKLVLPLAIVSGKTASELEPIVAHELVHFHRGDTWCSMFSAVARAVWWFHPLVWIAVQRFSYECERCVDKDVIALMSYSPAKYAESLLSVLESKCRLRSVVGSAGMNAYQITEGRLRFIMQPVCLPSRRSRWIRYGFLLLVALVVLPGAQLITGLPAVSSCS